MKYPLVQFGEAQMERQLHALLLEYNVHFNHVVHQRMSIAYRTEYELSVVCSGLTVFHMKR